MKKWIKPRVEIERFLPNEYMAACTVNIASAFTYADFNKDGAYPYNGLLIHNHTEDIDANGSYTITLDDEGYGITSTGWHENVILYQQHYTALHNPPRAYYNSSDAAYDIYVYSNKTAVVMKAGSMNKCGGGTSTADINYAMSHS